jgi:cell division protein FtsL
MKVQYKKQKKSKPNGITFGMVSVIIMAVSIILILTMVKIYLSNQIYYESKNVNKIQREVEALEAENMILKQNVETLKFKNRVTDTIFVINDSENE